jgi:anti-sigma regulatory factor (Ser/Thr protein kinase)
MCEELRLRLLGGRSAAAVARRELSRWDSDVPALTRETLQLLVTELVSNAVTHARAPSISVNVRVRDDAVRAEVGDPGPGFDPVDTGVPRDDHTGYALFLVNELAQRWGVAERGPATRVWFELPAA